jgi:hypothetical protein
MGSRNEVRGDRGGCVNPLVRESCMPQFFDVAWVIEPGDEVSASAYFDQRLSARWNVSRSRISLELRE